MNSFRPALFRVFEKAAFWLIVGLCTRQGGLPRVQGVQAQTKHRAESIDRGVRSRERGAWRIEHGIEFETKRPVVLVGQ